ncbi:MAG: hypothetical protein EKK34_19630 [Mycobacterium sp.]|nr:MAG: hypothetical protein EKK34_19630 [Mycobacterium sp.]
MSGPNPPGRDPDEPDVAGEPAEPDVPGESADADSDVDAFGHGDELGPLDGGEVEPAGETDAYSRAYSAPESELFSSSYMPGDLALYDYDSYDEADRDDDRSPRWPWVVGVAAILAAISLVVAVSLLVTRTGTSQLANPATTTSSAPPVQDQITTTKPPPSSEPPPPPSSEPPPPPPPPETPTATETQTVTVTPPPPPPPPPSTTAAPPPASSTTAAAPPPATTTPAGPRQVTYSVTGTKAPGDIISVTYVDASGRRRTQHNVYIPWSMTVTPISQSDVGSVEASSLFRVSRLNCSIITSDGTVLSSNTNDSPQTSC